ncbi:MAG: hypothetical protein IJ133_00760, partial [Clostridia bacterium]|nr:hypothetical protein [Clostridia bacterium]
MKNWKKIFAAILVVAVVSCFAVIGASAHGSVIPNVTRTQVSAEARVSVGTPKPAPQPAPRQDMPKPAPQDCHG